MRNILFTTVCFFSVAWALIDEVDEPDVFTLQKELTDMKSQVSQLLQTVNVMNSQLSRNMF